MTVVGGSTAEIEVLQPSQDASGQLNGKKKKTYLRKRGDPQDGDVYMEINFRK